MFFREIDSAAPDIINQTPASGGKFRATPLFVIACRVLHGVLAILGRFNYRVRVRIHSPSSSSGSRVLHAVVRPQNADHIVVAVIEIDVAYRIDSYAGRQGDGSVGRGSAIT